MGRTRSITAFPDNYSDVRNSTGNFGTFPDNYSDVRNPIGNFGTSNFLSIGRSPTNTSTSSQTAYVGFNLQSIIDEVKAISPTAFITNVRTQLVFQQTNTNTANPNNPAGVRRNPTITRVSGFQGFEVTGNFSESQAINPATPPATSNVSLFTGQIQQGKNTYLGRSVNQVNLLDQIIENRLVNENPNFLIALKARTTQNLPTRLGVFPIDDFFSQNSGTNNPNCPLMTKDCRPRLELTFDVFDQGFKVPEDPNSQAVPEPTSLISLLLLGTLGTTLKLRNNGH